MWGGLLTLLLGLLGWFLISRLRVGSAQGTVETVRTATVTRGDLRRTVRVSGTVGAKAFAAIVAPRMQGRGGEGGMSQMILVKLAAAGSRVKKGDLVAEFDRQWQLQRIEDRQAQVTQAEANIAKRKAELSVVREATLQNVRVAKADLDKARLDLKTAEIRSSIDAEKMKLAVEEAEARYKQMAAEAPLMEVSQKAEIRALEYKRDEEKIDTRRAEINAGKMIIRAPMDGLVVMMTTIRGNQPGQVQEGDQVFPGSLFMQIVDPSAMVVNATVNQAESHELRLGQKAEIRLDAYPDRVWPGRLISLGAMAGGSSYGFRGGSRALYVRQVPLRFSIQAQEARIIPDLSGNASVLLEEARDAVLAPRDALREENGRMYAWARAAGGEWRKRQVEVGLRDHTEAVIRSGLSAGEEVALEIPNGKETGPG